MPRGDRTGPAGVGPMTGRGAGYCTDNAVPGFANSYGRGWGGGGGRGRGRGMGRGFRGGIGFGFRGNSPPWPYVGIGRGGLQRCGYDLDGPGATGAYQQTPPSFYTGTPPPPGGASFPLHMTKEEELDFLRFQAETIKGQLEQIETRMIELDSEE